MASNGPSITDIKRLFAMSSNRCAFPRCNSPLVINNSLVGEVCHIKGARPGSARYDHDQLPAERHYFDNLILLCPTHHAVIDADERSYSVMRLQEIKQEHEKNVEPINNGLILIAIDALHLGVSSKNQFGGITAHTVNLGDVIVNSPKAGDSAFNGRQIEAVEKLWDIIRRFGDEFKMLILVDTIFIPDEIDEYVRAPVEGAFMEVLLQYRAPNCSVAKFASAGADSAARERPFVSQKSWGLFSAIQTVYGRAAFLVSKSFQERRYVDWHNDPALDQLLRAVLAGAQIDELKANKSNGLRVLIDYLENEFLSATGLQRGGAE